MRTGVPPEVKKREYRVAITPTGVHELVDGESPTLRPSEQLVGAS